MSEEGKEPEVKEPTDNQPADDQNTGTEDITQSDVFKKKLQSEEDKIRTKYVSEMKKVQAELEALKVKGMDEKEKAKYEREQKENELKQREEALTRSEMKIKAVDLLAEAGLSVKLRDVVVGSSEEETIANIELQKQILEESKNSWLKEHGRTPPKGGDNTPAKMTLEQIAELPTRAERSKARKENGYE